MSKETSVKMTNGRKLIAAGLCLLLVAMALASCSGAGSQSKTNSDLKGQTVFGKVTKVSSDSISIDLQGGTMPGGAPQGQPPEKQDSDNSGSDSDSSQNQAPQGQPSSSSESSAETAVITIDKDTEITQGGMGFMGMPGGAPDGQPPEMPEGFGQSESIELSDVKEGDIVAITIDENGKATAVNLMSGGFGQGGPGAPGENGSDNNVGGSDSSAENGESADSSDAEATTTAA